MLVLFIKFNLLEDTIVFDGFEESWKKVRVGFRYLLNVQHVDWWIMFKFKLDLTYFTWFYGIILKSIASYCEPNVDLAKRNRIGLHSSLWMCWWRPNKTHEANRSFPPSVHFLTSLSIDVLDCAVLYFLIFWVFLVFYCHFTAYLQNKPRYLIWNHEKLCLKQREAVENANYECIMKK